MEMELDLSQELSSLQSMKVSPRLVAASYILELSSQELQQQIAAELNDNPALDLVDIPTCHVCGSELQGSVCPWCIQRQKGEEPDRDDPNASPYEDPPATSVLRARDEDGFDPLTQVASEETLAEKLLADLGAVLDERDRPIAEYLVGSLDDKGYLSASVEEVAYELEVDEDRVRAVTKQLQSLEPVGIGARNLHECLLIQLDYLEQHGIHRPYAREIISEHLVELGEHKFGKIAHALKISPEEVTDVWEFVKAKLNPHPAHGFSATNARDRDTRAMYIVPDVIISKTDNGFEVEIVESRRFALRVNPEYTRISSQVQRNGTELSAEEKRHVQQYVGRAKLFIANINQRRQTIHNITTCLIVQQRDFLERGVRYLRPLSRAAVAIALGIHESTVSRATAAKYVMLPDGEVMPFSHFFTPSLSIKDVIKELIEKEGRPLTDAQIAERLHKHGIDIARRTVAKYRMQLDILPSSLR
ncbi:MAG TPA: RNA polymerase factor sigma-54 [Chloroflexota bacterium]|nr:RNA polymerase factor sigma-54 [Chloroflexota bacterium]